MRIVAFVTKTDDIRRYLEAHPSRAPPIGSGTRSLLAEQLPLPFASPAPSPITTVGSPLLRPHNE
ncbi:MAG: hypothetical protein AAGF12_31975 [Myxococcota bacterium]